LIQISFAEDVEPDYFSKIEIRFSGFCLTSLVFCLALMPDGSLARW